MTPTAGDVLPSPLYAFTRKAHISRALTACKLYPRPARVNTPNHPPGWGVRIQPVTLTAPWYSAAYQAFDRLEIWTKAPVWGASMKSLLPM